LINSPSKFGYDAPEKIFRLVESHGFFYGHYFCLGSNDPCGSNKSLRSICVTAGSGRNPSILCIIGSFTRKPGLFNGV